MKTIEQIQNKIEDLEDDIYDEEEEFIEDDTCYDIDSHFEWTKQDELLERTY